MGLIKKVLIVAPVRICTDTWPNEIEGWEQFKDLKYEILHGPKKDKALQREADIYLINPEGLTWLLGAEKIVNPYNSRRSKMVVDLEGFKALGFDTLVVDELTRFKHVSSGRFKSIKHVLHLFKRRWGLTGSPAANGIMDLFGQMYVIDRGRALGQYITAFRSKYFVPPAHGFEWKLREGADKEIYEAISPSVLRLDAKDHIELPEEVPNNIYVDLPPKGMEIYKQLLTLLVSRIEEKVVSAANAAVASQKCRQVANGALFHDPEVDELGLRIVGQQRTYGEIHWAKIEALTDLVEELQEEPLLVAYEFNHDEERLRKAFPKAVFACDYKPTEFRDLSRRWNNGEISLLFGQQQALAHGLNLQEAGHHICWFGMCWDFELYDQFNRRVRRPGNKHQTVFIHHIIARGTVDELILERQGVKNLTQQELFQALKKMAKMKK